ncbi:N5-carboxyaminoimidazole ribonucleotide synthase [Vallitalea longa]|uniref:N5-carboxyaminoimidazole ribonucleotide synthase n=1 Tax=Vallitalea longa TaxID=2936439 RepID=A0A9W6DI04_9FIRM|nr:5-(carboxyamino)imidazole ribonucleotide synthase [Vallitalea longa]GKX31998.1 N5-carboxyaminoimidazole ribonucleotide synthase [Vallitalea longa]
MDNLSKKIGIIGGGQLGKMMILEAKRLGFYVITLDPSESCPSHSISDKQILASFDDKKAIRTMAEKVDVMTYEFEHINVDILKELENEGYTIYPTAKSLEIIQNKYNQKVTLLNNNIAVPEFQSVKSIEDIQKAGHQFSYPMMLKTCTGGYDGKGNYVIENEESIKESYKQLGNGTLPLMVEKFVDLKKEISVLACRGIDGEISVYPVGENIHKDSILDETRVPASISMECTEKAMDMAHQVMEIFSGVGMFCVEMFVTQDDDILINEVAPRPHNSGHYTIEGCFTSQFEQHIRAITGLPLGDVSLRCPTVMRNIIGENGESGKANYEGIDKVYKDGNVKVHIYGKEEVRPKRKMGHITVIGRTLDEVVKKAETAKNEIKVVGEK